MENNKQDQFNRALAFDELVKIMTLPPDSPPSQSLLMIMRAQNFMQTIFDCGFKEGFEKGCDASKKVDEL